MKKTLLTIATLALCGAAVAGTYDASDYTKFEAFNPYKVMEAVTLNVSQGVTYTNLTMDMTSSTTLTFTGTGIISVTSSFALCTNEGSNAVTGEGSAVTYWESELLKATEAPAVVTLISSTATSFQSTVNSNLTFMGASKNGSVTLGDTDLTYLGAFTVSGLDEAKALITNDNEIAVAYVKGSGATNRGLFLVGKATATTPEPATATLSLLALAGMVTRRRRK